ncbi:MAG: permease [Pseudomonadales bacterium]|nr:permease [Pseudomonadales bacterium]
MSKCCKPETPLPPPEKKTACCQKESGLPSESQGDRQASAVASCCPLASGAAEKRAAKPDVMLWGSLALVAVFYSNAAFFEEAVLPFDAYGVIIHAVFELINSMWWGVAIGILMLSLLSKIPREFVISILGRKGGVTGICRATAAGVLLDLCSHGILMVGSKLYERGATVGQVMAFLIASPWNSFSLTLILVALIGLPWTVVFILFSMLIAIVAGLIFDALVARGVLPKNPNRFDLPSDFSFTREAKAGLKTTRFSPEFLFSMLLDGIKDSRMVLRWLLFGVLLAALIRAFIPEDIFHQWFGPSFIGLLLTMFAATVIEVCSEGSTPIAADLVTRAAAPGNGFAFLMTGVSTDYTEIMVMKDVSRSWKIALFLPLLTVPQVVIVSWLMNLVGG